MVQRIVLPLLPLLLVAAGFGQTTFTQSRPQICCGVTLDNGAHYSFELYSDTSLFTTNVFGQYEQGTEQTDVAPVSLPPCNRPYEIQTTFSLDEITLPDGHTGNGFGGLAFTCIHVPNRNGGTWVLQRWATYSELTFN